MKKITFLMLIFLGITLTQAQVPQSERDALIALYNATDGPNWTHAYNWNTSNQVSTWTGVTVNNINGQDHVTRLDLSRKNLSGSLPSEIGDFPELIFLQLRSNNLTGTIPSEIGNLSNLSYLSFSRNQFSGNLPLTIGNLSNLSVLNLGGNNFSGDLPVSLSNLTNLTGLYFWNNHFSGPFPDISNAVNLYNVNITGNDFQLADLEPTYVAIKARCEGNGGGYYYIPMNPVDTELSIDMVNGNNYSFNMPTIAGTNVTYQWYRNGAPIPNATSQTYNITNAQHSDLGDYTCKAQGSIIPDLTIDRKVIHLYGTVDAGDKAALLALYNATDGDNWTVHTNWNSTQPVYTWYGVKMQGDRVSEINLHNNNLNGSVPVEIGNLTNLEKLDLRGPDYLDGLLTGSIPSEIGNLTNLKYLWLDFNQLSGTIPVEIGNLTQLKDLSFWMNDLTGIIPSEFGNLVNLETISLEDNHLTGNIPVSFANLTKMRSFWVNGNQLSGDVPDIFGNWPDLYYFSIGIDWTSTQTHNQFTGDLDLSQNTNLHGVWLDYQAISTVDLRNGHNGLIRYFQAQNNPNLTCIFVDDAAYSTSYWTNIDATAHFVETQADCDALSTPEFDQDLIALYPNPTTDKVYIQNNGLDIKNIEVQNLTGQTVINNDEQTQIDLNSLSAGVYLIKITDQNDKIGVYKIVKK